MINLSMEFTDDVGSGGAWFLKADDEVNEVMQLMNLQRLGSDEKVVGQAT